MGSGGASRIRSALSYPGPVADSLTAPSAALNVSELGLRGLKSGLWVESPTGLGYLWLLSLGQALQPLPPDVIPKLPVRLELRLDEELVAGALVRKLWMRCLVPEHVR